MIPNDGFTIIVINILFVLGLLGLFQPSWFLTLTRFPFFRSRSEEQALTPERLAYAKRWGMMSLLGSVVLYFLMSA